MEKKGSGKMVRSISEASYTSEGSVEVEANKKSMEMDLNLPKKRLVKKMMYDSIKAALFPPPPSTHKYNDRRS